MREILFLTHRIPYPPNKGDKIRSYNLLKHLGRQYRVYLGAFIDEKDDWVHADYLDRRCAGTCFRPLPGWRAARGLAALAAGQPLTTAFYTDRQMTRWVENILRTRSVEAIVVFSSTMGQFVPDRPQIPVITDFVDVDSEKWSHYASSHHGPMRWVYAREARLLSTWERSLAQRSRASVFVSEPEARLFISRNDDFAERVSAVENGVDTDYFDPSRHYPNPYSKVAKTLVFTGAMDYWANADAVNWFANNIWPDVRLQEPNACFCIVGANPTRSVRHLESYDGIIVTGRVEDVRPYLAHASAAVAPLRVARGVQNKVLEAMAMAKPVLATTAAMDGIPAGDRFATLIVDDEKQLAQRAVELLNGRHVSLGQAGREFALSRYVWDRNLARFEALLAEAIAQGAITPQPPQPEVSRSW